MAKKLTSRYTLQKDCKHFVERMSGSKGSVLVTGKCSKCGVSVFQDRTSWEEEKEKRERLTT